MSMKLAAVSVRLGLRVGTRLVGVAVLLLLAASFVPADELFYRVENVLSYAGPLGGASQHVRSVPSTFVSIVSEAFQGRSLEIEGVDVNLNYAVNPSGQVTEATLASKVLGEDRTYSIYLPPGYDESSNRYPTLYLLHGMSQGHRWWTEVARVDRIATAMITSGEIRPLIIVMPDGNRVESDVSTTSLYDNRCNTGLDVFARLLKALGDRIEGLRVYKVSCNGNFQDFIVQEVVAEIDSTYKTDGERYIGGFSIGGRGALQLALGNEDVFDGAFGLSGNYDFLRRALRDGAVHIRNGLKLFLASGDHDQRGVYGLLNTFLFHRDLNNRGVDHLYCTYSGTHSDVGWVKAMPEALRYLLGTATSPAEAPQDEGSCINP